MYSIKQTCMYGMEQPVCIVWNKPVCMVQNKPVCAGYNNPVFNRIVLPSVKQSCLHLRGFAFHITILSTIALSRIPENNRLNFNPHRKDLNGTGEVLTENGSNPFHYYFYDENGEDPHPLIPPRLFAQPVKPFKTPPSYKFGCRFSSA